MTLECLIAPGLKEFPVVGQMRQVVAGHLTSLWQEHSVKVSVKGAATEEVFTGLQSFTLGSEISRRDHHPCDLHLTFSPLSANDA